MAEHLRVTTRGFVYPVGESLTLVRSAGGLSKLTPAQRGDLTLKRVEIGDDCDDMPAESAAIFLARGQVARVTVDDVPTQQTAPTSRAPKTFITTTREA